MHSRGVAAGRHVDSGPNHSYPARPWHATTGENAEVVFPSILSAKARIAFCLRSRRCRWNGKLHDLGFRSAFKRRNSEILSRNGICGPRNCRKKICVDTPLVARILNIWVGGPYHFVPLSFRFVPNSLLGGARPVRFAASLARTPHCQGIFYTFLPRLNLISRRYVARFHRATRGDVE